MLKPQVCLRYITALLILTVHVFVLLVSFGVNFGTNRNRNGGNEYYAKIKI